MARWRGEEPQRVEPPTWYRFYDPEAWDKRDAEEIQMTAGLNDMLPWLHDHHARRRWASAKHAYRQEHPLLATQEFNDIVARRSKRRDGISPQGEVEG